MSENLVIRNFGPIREANIELKDLTIFVGPQATGKSLASQILHFLRGIDDLINASGEADPENEINEALSAWLGNPLEMYTRSGSIINWKHKSETRKLEWRQGKLLINDALISTLFGLTNGFSKAKQVYIPSGRLLFSFVPPHLRVYPRLATEWPAYLLPFYETLGRALRLLWQKQERQELPALPPFLQERVDSILKGEIRYGPDTVSLKIGQTHLKATTLAAGQMELWPFLAIVEAGLNDNTLFSQQLFFEEPEAHLHPAAQKALMEVVAYLVRSGTKFVITTHSPYILYAVNNFLMAQEVLEANLNLPDDISSETALQPKQVAAYRFTPEGHVENIMDVEVDLIDEEELNRTANELGSDFTRLQERLGGYE